MSVPKFQSEVARRVKSEVEHRFVTRQFSCEEGYAVVTGNARRNCVWNGWIDITRIWDIAWNRKAPQKEEALAAEFRVEKQVSQLIIQILHSKGIPNQDNCLKGPSIGIFQGQMFNLKLADL